MSTTSRRLLLGASVTLVLAFALRGVIARQLTQRALSARADWRLREAVRDLRWATKLAAKDTAQLQLAETLQLCGDYAAADTALQMLLDRAATKPRLRARALNAAGVNQFQFGETDRAIELHDASLRLADEIGDAELRARALIDLSRVLYFSKGEVDTALERLHEALDLARQLDDLKLEADALRNIGVVLWWFESDLDRSLAEYYEPALELYRRIDDRRGAAVTLSNIGLVYERRGDFFQFLEHQTESIALKSSIGDLAGLGESYFHIGTAYNEMGYFRKAVIMLRKSAKLYGQGGNELGQREAEAMMAGTHILSGDFDRAITAYTQLSELAQASPTLHRYRLGSLAEAHLWSGDYPTAREVTARALALHREVGGPDRMFESSMMTLLGETYLRTGDLDEAERYLREAQRIVHPRPTARTSVLISDLELARDQPDRAITTLLIAASKEIDVLSPAKLRMTQRFSEQIYDRLFELLLTDAGGDASTAAARTALAYEHLEEMRYRSFRNLVVQLSAGDSVGASDNQADTLAAADRALREQEATGVDLEAAYSDYEDALLRAALSSPRYALLSRGRPSSLAAVQAALNSHSVLVAYVFTDDRAAALLVSPTAVEGVELPSSRVEIAAKVKLLRSLIERTDADDGNDAWLPVARKLHAALIAPLEATSMLNGAERLALIPFGELHDLPFAVLARSDDFANDDNDASVRYLIEDYALFRLPSATFLTTDRALPDETATLPSLVFGLVKASDAAREPLPHAETEARAVADAVGGELRVGHAASETELKSRVGRHRLLHLATHAATRPQMPLLSAIQLRPTAVDDGNLTVGEVLNPGLRAELVTLSACRSGLGQAATGERRHESDRLGLVEAFLHSGAAAVLAAVFPVSDEHTAEFMTEFYRRLNSADRADALAETQREVLRSHRHHPRYWAPFVLVGAPG